MMDDLPPELRARRDEIRDRVVRRGRTVRRRRGAAVVAAVLVVVAIPAAAIALTAGSDHHGRIAVSAPSTTEARGGSSTGATPSTGRPASASSSSIVPATVTSTTGVPRTSTSILVCHNSTNPACGPRRYVPPITNQGATLQVVKVSPAAPTIGQKVIFTLRAVDPDSRFVVAGIWCDNSGYSFGDASFGYACFVACNAVNEYGPWDPPPAHPSDLTFTMEHVYAKAGTFQAKFGATAEACGPRTSMASTAATVTVTGTPPTT